VFRSKLGLLFVVVALGSTLAGGTGSLQSDLGAVLKADPRNNEGFVISVRYRPAGSVLIYDLESVSSTKSMADVFRVFLQFAQAEKGQAFKSVELAFRGQTRFVLSGEYFKKLGDEYGVQNPVFTMRTFTENLSNGDGSRAYPTWSGGLLGVTSKQVEQFNDFHQRWWMRDMVQLAPGAQTTRSGSEAGLHCAGDTVGCSGAGGGSSGIESASGAARLAHSVPASGRKTRHADFRSRRYVVRNRCDL
jgi:hypothetical protein